MMFANQTRGGGGGKDGATLNEVKLRRESSGTYFACDKDKNEGEEQHTRCIQGTGDMRWSISRVLVLRVRWSVSKLFQRALGVNRETALS